MTERSAFSGGDQAYLRNEQYKDGAKLDARVALHRKFSSSKLAFPDFAARLIEWPAKCEVLECGTGTGQFWANDEVPRSASLTLTDLSPGMVREATARASSNGFTQVTPGECDVQNLPFATASFDIVIANHMLYHVPDPDAAIAELARVLRPSGMLMASTNGSGHMAEILDAVAEVFGPTDQSLHEVFGIDSGEARLREQFGAVVWHAYDNDLVVDDLSAALAYALSFPPGESADESQAAEVDDALGRRVVNGRLHIRTRGGVFVCSKARRRSSSFL